MKGDERHMPQLPDDTIAGVLEGVVDLDWQIAACVVVGRTLFVLTRRLVDRKDLGPSRGDDVLVFGTGLFVGHTESGATNDEGTGEAGVADENGCVGLLNPGPQSRYLSRVSSPLPQR